jgi:hypothetical protein
MILQGEFKESGICAPERIGLTGDCFRFILKHLESFNIKLEHIEREI